LTAFFYGEMALQKPEDIAKKNTASQTSLIEGSSTQFVPSINVSNKHNEGIQLAGGGSFLFDLLGKAAKNQGDFLEVFNRLNSGSVTKSLDGAPNVPEKVPFLQTEGLATDGYSATQTKAILGKKHLSESGYEKFKAQDYKSVDTDAPGLNTDAQQALSDIEAEQLADQEIVKDAKASVLGETQNYKTDTGAMSFNKIEELTANMKRDAESLDLDGNGDFNFENIEAPDDVKLAIAAVTETFDKKQFTRGTKSHEETIKEASEMLADEIGLSKRLLNRKSGELLNAAEMTAARTLLTISGKKLVKMMEQIASGNATEYQLLQYRRQNSIHAALVLQVKGAITEAARATNSFNIKVGGDMDPARAMELARLNMQGESLDATVEMAKAQLKMHKKHGLKGLNKMAEKGWYVTTKRAVHELFLSSILSAMSSNMRNMFGNASYMVYQLPSELLAGLYSDFMRMANPKSIRSLAEDQKYTADAFIRAGGWINANKDAWKAFKYAWTNEMPAATHKLDVESMAAIKAGSGTLTGSGTTIGEGLNWAGRITRVPLTFLMGMDEYFKTIIQNGELAVQAHQKFQHTLRTSGGNTELAKDAAAMVFLDPLSKAEPIAARALKDTLTEELHNVIKVPARLIQNNIFGRFLMPFTTSPTNGFKQVLINTPFLQNLNPTLDKDLLGMNGFAAQQNAIGRVSFSYGTAGIIMKGASDGRITGGWPVDKDEKEQLPQGWLPYSFVLKGEGFPQGMPLYDEFGVPNGPLTYVSYAGIEPVGGIIATIADTWISGSENFDLWQDPKESLTHLGLSAAISTARYYKELPFLQGMADIVDFIESVGEDDFEGVSELDRVVRSGAENFPFIFSALQRSIGRTIDPAKYDISGSMPELWTREELETKHYNEDGTHFYIKGTFDNQPDLSYIGTPKKLGSTFDGAFEFARYVRDYSTKNTVQPMGLVDREGKSSPRYDTLGFHIDADNMSFRSNPIRAMLTAITGVRMKKGEEPTEIHKELLYLAQVNKKDGWPLTNPKDKDGLKLTKGVISDWMALAKSQEHGIKIAFGNEKKTFRETLESLLNPNSWIGDAYANASSDEEKWAWFQSVDKAFKEAAWEVLLDSPGYENLRKVWNDKSLLKAEIAEKKANATLEDYQED